MADDLRPFFHEYGSSYSKHIFKYKGLLISDKQLNLTSVKNKQIWCQTAANKCSKMSDNFKIYIEHSSTSLCY